MAMWKHIAIFMCSPFLAIVHKNPTKTLNKAKNMAKKVNYSIIAMVIYRRREGGINYETQKSSCCNTCSSNGNVIRHDGMRKRLLQLKLLKRTDIIIVVIINTGIVRT